MWRKRRADGGFRYSAARRCPACRQCAVIPTEADADWFVMRSEGGLHKQRCPAGNGWHVLSRDHRR